MTPAESPVVVLTTLGSSDAARDLVRRLVEDRLVACGTVLPGATSIYRWQESVTSGDEVLVVLKTVRGRWDALVAAVDRHHPYDTPELIVLPVEGGLPRYVEWLRAQVAA